MAKLTRTRQADIDLLELWAFIAKDDYKAADSLILKLHARSQQLILHPQLGVERNDIVTGMRHLPVGNHLILYRIICADIEIVRYLHGARNLHFLSKV